MKKFLNISRMLFTLILFTNLFTACNTAPKSDGSTTGGGTTPVTATPTPVTLASIAVTPANPTVTVLMTASLTATGTYSDNTTADVTSTVTWSSDNTTVASLNMNVATGNAVGTANITASLNGVTSPATVITVTAATLTGITISPTAPSVPKGLTQQFTAQGSFNNGTTGDITASAAWSTSNAAVATLSASGLASTPGQGTSNITASLSGLTSNMAVLTVTAPVLSSIAVTPANPTVTTLMTTNLTATGTYSDGTTALVTNTATWTSANTGIATVSATGVATGVATGSTNITASQNGIISPVTTITVTSATLVSIAVTPAAPNVAKGLTKQFTATGTYNNMTTGNITGSVTWISSNTTVATISAAGLATTLIQGTTNITADLGGITSPAQTLTVIAPVQVSTTVTPNNNALAKGETLQLVATENFSDGTTAIVTNTAAWGSSNGGAIIISGTGLATGNFIFGTAVITATFGGFTGSTSISLVPAWTWVNGSSTAGTTGVYGTKGTAAATNVPGARDGSISWIDGTGNLWLFGGNTPWGYLNDLWKWNGTQWTWVSGSSTAGAAGVYGTKGTAAATNVPGARYNSISWTDLGGNLLLFGGYGYDSAGTLGNLNDLWKWDGTNWTWISGNNVVNTSGVYGTKGTAAATNIPGSRYNSASWTTGMGNTLWLFGGVGKDSAGTVGYLNDLWKWDGTNWTWVSGSNTVNAIGVYGTQGIASASNDPGNRRGSVSWTDSTDQLWLFGGYMYNSGAATLGYLNDLWKWNGTQWTWVSGNSTVNTSGVYGIQGVTAATNVPGSREDSIAWIDGAGNVWLFGGYGYGSSTAGDLNDLWKWDGTNWTWVNGSKFVNFTGVYGTLGAAAAANVPGARFASNSWIDAAGSLWLFGGMGYSTTAGRQNDLWKYSF